MGRTGGQLELFSMEKVYRDRICSSKAQTSDSRFSYSCSMLDLPWRALRNHLAGWSPGTRFSCSMHLSTIFMCQDN